MNSIFQQKYDSWVDEVISRHFPSATVREQLFARAQMMRNIMIEATNSNIDHLSSLLDQKIDQKDFTKALENFDKLQHAADWLGKPDHAIWSMSNEQLKQYGFLTKEIENKLSDLHAHNPEECESFVKSILNRTAEATKSSDFHQGKLPFKPILCKGDLLRNTAIVVGVGLIGYGAYRGYQALFSTPAKSQMKNWTDVVTRKTDEASQLKR